MGSKKKETLIQFNRKNIIDSAKKLFEIKGIDQTTMDDIAKDADYSKSTIYVYFKSKEEIYNSIVCEYMELLKNKLAECIENSAENGFEECYFAICNSIIDFQEQFPLYYESLLGEINVEPDHLDEDNVMAEIYKNGEEINNIISTLLQTGIEKKFIREDIELIPTVFFVWSSISGIILMAGKKKKYFEIRLGMSHQEYLNYSFKLLLQSIIN